MAQRQGRMLGVAIGVVAACEAQGGDDLLEVEYISEKAEVGTDVNYPLCEGDLRFIDSHVSFLEHTLGVRVDKPIRVDIYSSFPVPGCSSGAGGCFKGDHINTSWVSIGHELVHAVAREVGRPSSFWHEGLAEALSDTFIKRGEAGVVESLDLPNTELDYFMVGHFVRWLIESRGMEAFLRFYASGDFAGEFGETVAAAEQAYFATAPWGYPRQHPCPQSELAFEGGGLEAAIEVSCADPESTRFGGIYLSRVSATRTLVIPEDGMYELDVRSGWAVELVGCRTEIVETEPEDRMRGDVWDETKTRPPELVWQSGGTYELELEAANYRVRAIANEDEDGAVVEFSLRRLSK